MKKEIIIFADWGLCNRLKCLVSCMRIADKLKRDFILYWPKNRHLGADFSDLFENEFKQLNDKEINNLKEEKKIGDTNLVKEDLNKKRIIVNTSRFILFEGEVKKGFSKEFPNEEADNIDFEFNRTPLKLKNEILKYIKKLKIKKNILRITKDFNEKNYLESCYGVHIRRGDFSSMMDGRVKISRDELFITEMKNILKKEKNTKFFVSTDSLEVEARLKKDFGEKIITFLKKGERGKGFLGSQEALIDLLLLSKTKGLLLSYGTSFSEFAWWLGGCKAKVKIIGIEEEKNKIREKFKKNKKTPVLIMKIRKKINSIWRFLKGEKI
jgi:hypothetical protein